MIGGGEPIPLHDIPAVAEVVKRIYDRPFWQHAEPIEIDQDLYRHAKDEFAAVLEQRGWALSSAEIERENFLLRGVTIVMGDE